MLGINNYIIYGLIIGSVVTLMPYISGKQGHEPRLKILANLVMVKDTDHLIINVFIFIIGCG